ncbi:phosphopyruvate hydratase [Candidatus Woesearchaeota archaeon]|nr:phosphopyruvate hydratase [Candidatus Woesearchaeota archaeon]
MLKILKIKSREILDSRGNPTVETEIHTKKGISKASVPSGASTGIHEAVELRDGGKRYLGMGVSKAVKNVNTTIAKKMVGKSFNQESADKLMIKLDGTANKSKLGANAILSVSMALCKASALEKRIPLYKHIAELFNNKKLILPIPAFNIINGGQHAGNQLEIQEYMLLPTKAKSFKEAMQIGSEVYHELKKLLAKEYGKIATNVGDEGGFAPPMTCYEEPLDYIMDAVEELGYFKKIKLGIDAAATSFYRNGKYYLEGSELSSNELIDVYIEMANAYPIVSIEDPFVEDDFEYFAKLNKKIKGVQVVGDDLLCTNPQRIQKAIIMDSCNALLLKINQIGTITEALDAADIVMKQKWNVMVSHRSGETDDSFIADLAVGLGNGQIKSGAPCRGERLAKYNQLLRIEEELGKKAKYGGRITWQRK